MLDFDVFLPYSCISRYLYLYIRENWGDLAQTENFIVGFKVEGVNLIQHDQQEGGYIITNHVGFEHWNAVCAKSNKQSFVCGSRVKHAQHQGRGYLPSSHTLNHKPSFD